MSLSTAELENQERLKQELQKVQKASKLEDLAAALIGRLLDVPIAVAKSGFQHGADAGPAGQQGRRFRIECKKYSDTTDLNERELLGEVDQALMRDEALEAWVLVVTRSVSEQIRQSLNQHGERLGVPVLIIDWIDHEVAPLAALCAFAPDLVEKEFSKEAGAAACTLQPISEQAIERLRRDLQSWCLGFEAIRTSSHDKLNKIWNSPRESKAAIGQNAAGGAQEKRVKRSAVHKTLNAWWQGAAQDDAPAAVVGLEGVGKTWATLHWLIDSKDEQPIVLMIPSSTAATVSNVSETSVKQLLANRLYEMNGGSVRNHEHWLRRLDRLLARPADEGPVLTVFLDGLNQEPSVPWLLAMKVLQGDIFAGRVRVIVSTRTHHFEEKLSGLRDLAVLAERVDVDLYDTAPGSELDQMLAFENLTQDDLHPDVIEWARKPRLFKLVVRFRDRLVEAGQITVHRLLWEYGRDAFGERAGKSFSENEWKGWLKEIAQGRRQGIEKYSERSLGEMVNRPDLNENEVYARLSDIIDGRFATRSASGDLQLTPAVIAHALGVALLNDLSEVTSPTFETIDATLAKWLDHIAGFDEQAEILRAAVSILVEQGCAAEVPVPGVLVTAWLQSQNIPDEHRQELVDLAPHFPEDALLDTIEHSDSHTHDYARFWAVNALSKISRDDSAALDMIVGRACRWLSVVSYDGDRLKRLIGSDTLGPITVIGVELEQVDRSFNLLKAVVPLILEGFPLANALPIFETAAVALVVGGRSSCWDGLKWLCLLNEVDSDETATALRGLSEEISRRQPEQGVHPDLPKRIAALLLWLTGQDEDEDAAVSVDPGIDRPLTYEKDYLPQPGRSWFPLERRHAHSVLTDTELPLHSRVQRTEELWLDPSFGPPASFVEEICAAATCIDVEKLNRHGDLTSEDDDFERLEPVLARCAPDLLADLIRRKMRSMATCPPESRHWSAIHATDHLVLAGEDEAAAARALRLSVEDEEDDASDANNLLLIELRNLDAQDQFDELIHADLKYISTNFAKILRPPTPNDVDGLIARYADGSLKQQRDLLILLSIYPVELTDTAWSWVEKCARCQDNDSRGFAFRILTHADPVRFGQTLEADGWSWKPDEHDWVNCYGMDALIKATLDIPFDQLAPRLAPWWLLEAVRQRGVAPTEVRLAAKIFGQLLDGKHRSEAISYCAEDFVPVLQHAPDIVEQWLEGCTEVTTDFRHRIFFAERAYIALCEALLAHDPERGAPLWRTLRATMITRYIGAGGVEDLLHMVFRVPDSPAVKALRKELVELEHCHTDQALFNLAIAASCNGKDDWLATLIEQDQASKFAWRRERAAVLAGFTANNTLPVEGAWPDREIKTGYADLAQKAARYRWAEACARHWWRAYLASSDPTEAYAAWVLFLSSADRRCWAWMNQDIEAAQESDDFFKLKMIHARLNH